MSTAPYILCVKFKLETLKLANHVVFFKVSYKITAQICIDPY